MAESRKVRRQSKTQRRGTSPAPRRRTTASKPRVKARALQEQPSFSPVETPEPLRVDQPQPVLLVGSILNDAEVVVLDPEGPPRRPPGAAPAPMTRTEVLALGGFVVVVVATIIGGLHVGYSLKGRIAQIRDQKIVATQPAEDSPRALNRAESLPPRHGTEWKPDVPGVHRVTQAASQRELAPTAPALIGAEEGRLWPRLTGLMRDGIRLHREGWYGPATARFREAVAVMPDYLRAYLWLGRSGFKAGRYDEARRALHQVIVLDPESVAAQEAKALLSQIDKDN